MTKDIICDKKITEGNASRFIKETWLVNGNTIDITAFDLRDTTPPETYVSFFLVNDNSDLQMVSAYFLIKEKLSYIKNGAIIILEIKSCLEEVNDEDIDLICFKDQKTPHCGLHYLTSDLAKLTEVKNTLCYLALERIHKIEEITSHIKNAKQSLNGY